MDEIQNLKKEWNAFECNLENSVAQKKAFDDWMSNNPLETLTLKKYTNLKNSNVETDYFTNWLERKTASCGRFFSYSDGYGIYRSKEGAEIYKTSENALEPKEATEYFNEKVLPILIILKEFKDLDTKPLNINFARKVAYMFNADKLLPIFNRETIESIAQYIDIKDLDLKSYKCTEKILQKLVHVFEIKAHVNFEITQRLGSFLWDKFGKKENKLQVWKFSPGENAKDWPEMRDKDVAALNYGITEPLVDKNKNQISELTDNGVESCMNFLEAKENDMIFAFDGRSKIIGYGIVLSSAQYSMESISSKTDGYHNYLNVEWHEFPEPIQIIKKVAMGTFLDISKRADELKAYIEKFNNTVTKNGGRGEKSENGDNQNMPALNQILYGPPGTGKTFNTVIESLKIFENTDAPEGEYLSQKKRFDELKEQGRIAFVTFHQSFSYEDFVEGIRAEITEGGQPKYAIRSGVFKEISNKAKDNPVQPYILIIDEINRGNTSKIFGELITLIEDTKRLGSDESIGVTLPYSSEKFSVPKNLYIIGTMNTADRSLALIDTALRRRFDFIEMMPDASKIKVDTIEGIDIREMLKVINMRIEALYDREHTIGHAFFMKLDDDSTVDDLSRIFKNKILPLLEEYFFEDWEKICSVLGGAPFYRTKDFKSISFDRKCYERDIEALKDPKTYVAIYTDLASNTDAETNI